MLLCSLLFVAVTAAAPTSPLVVHEKRELPPLGTVKGSRVASDAILPIRIALTQSHLHEGYNHLMRVSHPHSPSYGQYWTIDEIHAEFAPSDEAVEAVKAWLEDAGLDRGGIAQSASRGWLAVDMSARDAERIFQTEYYEHVDAHGNVRVGCDKYHLPSHLSHHIDHVKPGVTLSGPLSKVVTETVKLPHFPRAADTTSKPPPNISATSLTDCGTWITPACIKALYNIPDAALNHPNNTLGVFEYGTPYNQLDLDLFFSHYAPWVPNGTHPTLASINNATAPGKPNVHGSGAVIDLDLLFSLTYPQTVTLYQVNGTQAQFATVGDFEFLLDAVDGAYCTEAERKSGADCGTTNLTNVLSTSYESYELAHTEAAAKRACHEYMKLGLKGHSVLFSGGDYGVGGSAIGSKAKPSNGCIDAQNVTDFTTNGTVFTTLFPASCPFVTAVGATQLNPGQTVNDTESAMDIRPNSEPGLYSFTSSGGFSNYFPVTAYQEEAINTYFNTSNPGYATYGYNGSTKSIGANGGRYNRHGRGTPDVSANGAHLATFLTGEFFQAGAAGTSLSTPIFASIVNLINEARLGAGKGPVGFINPVIYAHPEAFHDIVKGSNPGCGTAGFKAVKGWDPITGLGTPDYPSLLKVFMGLP